jgi:two-component system cell cycle response regulator
MTKILVVDADKINLELMVFLFKQFGYSIVTANDGEEAITVAKKELPDLIICDIELAKLNGFEVVKILKNTPELAHIPVVAVTAYAMEGDRNKIRTAGFDGYISKPIDPANFVHQMEALLPEELHSNIQVNWQAELADNDTKHSYQNRRLALIADNFFANRKLFKNLLHSIGFEVITVKTAKEAIEAMQEKKPDLILSASQLPDMTGIELLRIIQKDARLKTIPFVMMSAAHPTKEMLKEMKTLNIKRFILLPIESDMFTKVIKHICPSYKEQLDNHYEGQM